MTQEHVQIIATENSISTNGRQHMRNRTPCLDTVRTTLLLLDI